MNGRKIGETLKMLRSALTLQQVLAKSTEIPFLIKQKIFIDREFIDIQKFIPKILPLVDSFLPKNYKNIETPLTLKLTCKSCSTIS